MKPYIFVFLMSLLLLNAVNISYSQDTINTDSNNTQNIHDSFFVRSLFYFGYKHLSKSHSGDDDGEEYKIDGYGYNARFQFGFAPVVNNYIFFDFGYGFALDPDTDKENIKQYFNDADTALYTYDFGLGYCRYINPSDVYFSLSILTSRNDYIYSDYKIHYDWCIGLAFTVGKEWWFSDNFGLGVSVLGRISVHDSKFTNITDYYAGIGISAACDL